MVQDIVSAGGLWSRAGLIGQVPVLPGPGTPEQASLVFSGPQFFIALISGLLLAFAIQLLLTNLSVAAGISYLGRPSDSSSSSSSNGGSSSFGATIRKIEFGVGLWTLISVSIALFIACFLAVQLSLLVNPGLGAIVGLVIWAAYFSILVWVGSTTVGSWIGSIINTATSGFQAILGTAAAAIGGKAANRQVVATVEEAAAAVRREMGSIVDPESIRENIEDYVHSLHLPQLDLSAIRQDFEQLLNDPEFKSMADSGRLQNIDRQTFIDLVSSRTDFSKEDVNRIAGLLEGVWRQTLGQRQDRMSELIDYLRSSQPGQVRSEELNAKLDQLTEEVRRSRQGGSSSSQGGGVGPLQQTLQTGINTLMGLAMGRADLSDLDLDKILDRVQSVRQQLGSKTEQVAGQLSGGGASRNTVRNDVENYLLNAYSWQMNQEAIARDFRDVLYDPSADPAEVRRQLEKIGRPDFVEILSSRGVFTQRRIQEIANSLERVRREVMSTARAVEERERALELRTEVETYLTLTPTDRFTPEQIQRAFGAILADPESDHEMLSLRLAPYDRASLMQILVQRQNQRRDLTAEQIESLLNELEQTRDRVLSESQSLEEQARQQTEALWLRLESYLRNTGKDELNPNAIRNELQTMLHDPQAGVSVLRARLARFDHDTLVQLLSQRPEFSEDEADQILHQVENSWYGVRHAPQILASQARDQYDQATHALSEYLRNTQREELNPDGIRRDLQRLMDDPQAGASALRRRLSQVDRETLVQLLSQRNDLSEAQANEIIDNVQDAIRTMVRAPRRWALRTQRTVMDFEASVEDYLRNTDKAELNPDGIKRDLSMLVQHPRLGMETLGDRLSQFDRSTLVALLAQRQDMTKEEAERAVGQIESVRDQIIQQVRNVQYQLQSVVNRIFARLRDYLNSLERPELNYEGIKRDLRTLFDDPQAGFDALRARLSQFDRDTLVAIVSSRPDISERDVNRVIDQVENARNSVLRRAERMQLETQRRLDDLKREAQRQAEETRRAAASAAWWLFATAIVSAASSAVAGTVGVLALL